MVDGNAGDTVAGAIMVDGNAGDTVAGTIMVDGNAGDTVAATIMVDGNAGDTVAEAIMVDGNAGDTVAGAIMAYENAGDTVAFVPFIASSSSIKSDVLLKGGTLCWPPSLPWLRSQSKKRPGRAGMISGGWREISL